MKKPMSKEERAQRVIVRGEFTDHAHVAVGDAVIERTEKETLIKVGDKGAIMKHLLESEWLQGREVFTKDHYEIPLDPGSTYKYIPQKELHPYEKVIRDMKD